MHPAEQHAVLDRAFDYTAVGHHGVFARAAADVLGGHLVLYLGIDGMLAGEELLGNVLFEQRHAVLVVVVHGIEPCDVAIVLPAEHPDILYLFNEHVLHEVEFGMRGRVVHKVFEQALFHNVGVAADVERLGI